MPTPGDQEPAPSGEPLAYQGLYAQMLEAAEGDVSRAIDAVTETTDALVFTFGYMDHEASEGRVHRSEAHRWVAAKILGYLFEGSQGDTAVLRQKQELWSPVLSAVATYRELGSRWEKVRATVHLMDRLAELGELPPAGGGGGPSVLGPQEEHFSGLDVRGAVELFDAGDEPILRGE